MYIYIYIYVCIYIYIYIYIINKLCMSIFIYQKQDIYYFTSYISVSSKPLKTQSFEGLEEMEI